MLSFEGRTKCSNETRMSYNRAIEMSYDFLWGLEYSLFAFIFSYLLYTYHDASYYTLS